jgi:hypothetical protein
MVATALLANVAADSIALLILVYIVFKLAYSDTHYVKERMLQYYEAMKRDRVFRKSLMILALSMLCALAGALWTIYSSDDHVIIDIFQTVSAVFRILFFIYLLFAIKSA